MSLLLIGPGGLTRLALRISTWSASDRPTTTSDPGVNLVPAPSHECTKPPGRRHSAGVRKAINVARRAVEQLSHSPDVEQSGESRQVRRHHRGSHESGPPNCVIGGPSARLTLRSIPGGMERGLFRRIYSGAGTGEALNCPAKTGDDWPTGIIQTA